MKAAIYPGTFDPPTLGHLKLIERASRHFDRLIVAIGHNPEKLSHAFSVEERVHFLKTITSSISNVEITAFEGLLVDFAQAKNVTIIVRAIRSILDFEEETQQAHMNRQLANLETFYLAVDDTYRSISSTLVREVASYGKPLSHLVPPEIEHPILNRLYKAKV